MHILMISVPLDVGSQPEAVTRKAISIVHRVRDKLTGKDFIKADEFTGADVSEQVQQLIIQATAHENLCQCYIGWYVYVCGVCVCVFVYDMCVVCVFVYDMCVLCVWYLICMA